MKPQALLKKVICKAFEDERKTAGGIVLPDCHTKDQVTMEIVSKGKDVTVELKIGNKVTVGGFQGHDVLVDGEKYKLFEQDQILAVIDD